MVTSATAAPAAPTTTGRFRTADGLLLFEQAWTPEGPPRAAVALVHGYADHSTRHARLAAFLVERGHAVFAYDQRGHGRSEGERAFTPSFDRYVDDLRRFLNVVRRRVQGRPLYVLGHSMGGLATALLGLAPGPDVAGLVLSSPALRIGSDVPTLLRRAAYLVARAAPHLPTIRLDLDHLSHDPDVVAATRRDPLYYTGRMPAKTGAELLRAAARIRASMREITLPLLVLHGTDDRIADVTGSYELYRHAGSDDKTLALFEGFYHETFHEPERDRVLHALGGWLDERT